MRKSKRQLAKLAGGCLLAGVVLAFIHGAGLFASSMIVLGLIFTAWMLALVWRDHVLSQGNPVRRVWADYQEPPEVMSRGSRGLPTSFD